ncbi:MAG: hypothetical protein JJU00_14035 [Opitutales bacterium]|nr:hypothetical protein [Opitutales bacterium]
MQARVVEPELLDGLPEGHPDARRNRADLRRLNNLMGNYRWLRQSLRGALRPGDSIVEPGAGDGHFAAAHLGFLHGNGTAASYTGIDLWSRPEGLPPSFRWEQADALGYSGWPHHSIIVVNFLLHQFTDAELRRFGDSVRPHARVILANETARGPLRVWLARTAFVLGLNHVSRHDAVVSVRAGFRGEELPALLGLDPAAGWEASVHTTALGAYRLAAKRRHIP